MEDGTVACSTCETKGEKGEYCRKTASAAVFEMPGICLAEK